MNGAGGIVELERNVVYKTKKSGSELSVNSRIRNSNNFRSL